MLFKNKGIKMKILISIVSVGIIITSNIEAKELNRHQQGIVINLAGKQRMLTQKMTKEAMLIAKGINIEDNIQKLKNSEALFDKILKGFRNGDRDLNLPKTEDKEIIKQIDKVSKMWKIFKEHIDEVASGQSTKSTLEAIDRENIPLLDNMNIIVEMFEEKRDSKLDPQMVKRINLAGRERMLTQKMTKELLIIANSLQSKANQESLKSTGELFEKTLSNLMLNGGQAMKDTQIASRLAKVKRLWSEYQNIIANTDITPKGQKEVKIKQDIISKKLTKELLFIANRADAQIYKENLRKTGRLFDKTLKGLIRGDIDLGLQATKDDKILKQLKKVQELWAEYKVVIENADVSKAGLNKAITINMPLLENMDKVVKMYENSIK